MQFSEVELREIYVKSLPLKEVAALHSIYGSNSIQKCQLDKVDHWEKIISPGNLKNFEKRFLWCGIDPNKITTLLGTELSSEKLQLPGWSKTLNECLHYFSFNKKLSEDIEDRKSLDINFDVPFQEILLFFIDYARGKIKADLQQDYLLISEPAHWKLENNLLQSLSRLNALPMELEFSIFRVSRQSGLRRAIQSINTNNSNPYYKAFTKTYIDGAVLNYFMLYPVLARLIATTIDQWIASVKELISRFNKDKTALERTFNNNKELGKIIDITAPLSDRHNHGRSVMILQFESEVKLVYKPKPLGIELSYNKLIVGLNDMAAPLRLMPFRVLNFDDYGWAEWVKGKPSENRIDDQAYYRNAGGLLCLAYILGATDLHNENIIKHGIYPVLIDVETLLHPFAIPHAISEQQENAYTIANRKITESVLRTGLLPYWNLDEEGQAYDVSALGEFMPQEFKVAFLKWENVNTDQMKIKKAKCNVFYKDNGNDSKIMGNSELNLFSKDIIEGFSQMFGFLRDKRGAIVKSDFWKDLSGQTIRFVFRPTKIYSLIEQKLLHPQLLRNGMDRSIHLDILYKGKTTDDTPPNWWPLIEIEQEAMERMDIPHFSTKTDSDCIDLPGGRKIERYFTHSSFESATARLNQLSEEILFEQTEFIKGALKCRWVKENHFLTEKRKMILPVKSKMLTKGMALKCGISIASILKKKAITAKDGSMTWIAPKYYPGAKRYQLEPMSDSIYDGTGGVAIYFASLFQLTGRKEYRNIALASLKTAVECIWEGDFVIKSLGGFAGLGSYIYSFLKVGILTGEPRLLDAANKTAIHLSKMGIAHDSNYDILYGSSGLILSLLELYKSTKNADILDLLSHTGDHLLTNRKLTTTGYRAWESREGSFLSGFSHGAAGMAYALLKLYEVTHKIDYKMAALEAIAFENSIFVATESNWLDCRKGHNSSGNNGYENKFMSTWCHGASGIGLARMGALSIIDSPEIRYDIEVSLETTKKYLNSPADYVCCGNFGRLELLLVASQTYGDEKLRQVTLHKAEEIINLSAINGDFRYCPAIGFTPGFFQGISGIGYQILRLVNPETLSSILLLN